MRKYTLEHFWIELDNTIATIGLTEFLTSQMQEVQFVEIFAAVSQMVERGQVFGQVESNKMTLDLTSPFTGRLSELNGQLLTNPALLTASPEQDGWICRFSDIQLENDTELLDLEQYQQSL